MAQILRLPEGSGKQSRVAAFQNSLADIINRSEKSGTNGLQEMEKVDNILVHILSFCLKEGLDLIRGMQR